MRIVSIAARTIRWPIAGRGAARGRTERAAVLVEARTDRGAVGLGEAAPLPGMSRDTLDEVEQAIAGFAGLAPFEIARRDAPRSEARDGVPMLFEILERPAAHAFAAAPPAARFAIETALLDAIARECQVSIAALLRAWVDANPVPSAHVGAKPPAHVNAKPPAHVNAHVGAEPAAHVSAKPPAHVSANPSAHVNAHVGAKPPAHVGAKPPAHVSTEPPAHVAPCPPSHVGTPPNTLRNVPLAAVVDDPEDAQRAFAAGIRCFKIKLAADDDVGRVFAIAAAAPSARLRIDANRSWPRAEVTDRLAALASLPIDYVEEPCREAHRLLSSPLPGKLALDESLCELSRNELLAALRSPGLAAVILKPTLLGGLSAALEFAALARRWGVVPVASHALEGPIGTAACAELALALGGDCPVGLAPHAALAGWSIQVDQLAPGHVCAAAAAGLGYTDLDLAGVVQACSTTILGPRGDGEAPP